MKVNTMYLTQMRTARKIENFIQQHEKFVQGVIFFASIFTAYLVFMYA
mgnify:CR=1 FL=1|jgi:hypothetical protein